MRRETSLPLLFAPIGKTVKLVRVRGGVRMTRRLAEMGLTPGVELRVIQSAGGRLMISVRDSRLALGRGLAHRMRVSLVD